MCKASKKIRMETNSSSSREISQELNQLINDTRITKAARRIIWIKRILRMVMIKMTKKMMITMLSNKTRYIFKMIMGIKTMETPHMRKVTSA